MNRNPLTAIHETERDVQAAIAAAAEEAAEAVAEARRQAKHLIDEAGARGRAAAEHRYEEGIARARDSGDRIRSGADERVAALRRRAEPHLTEAVDLVMHMVLSTRKDR
jgi:vacuolar-type H+-ATPase subunit H